MRRSEEINQPGHLHGCPGDKARECASRLARGPAEAAAPMDARRTRRARARLAIMSRRNEEPAIPCVLGEEKPCAP